MVDQFVKVVEGQEFPAIYCSEPIPFRLGNNPSGARSARAVASFTLNTNPGNIFGIRVSNLYELPVTPDADTVQLFEYLARVTDLQQSVSVRVAQQNITLNAPVHQAHISGTAYLFYAWPEAFPVEGSNNITVEIRRLTSYPDYFDGEIQTSIFPEAMVSLVGNIIVAAGPQPAIRRNP